MDERSLSTKSTSSGGGACFVFENEKIHSQCDGRGGVGRGIWKK